MAARHRRGGFPVAGPAANRSTIRVRCAQRGAVVVRGWPGWAGQLKWGRLAQAEQGTAVLFNSFEFAAFLAAVLALFHGVTGWPWRKAVLVAASYAFYAAWSPAYVLLLVATTALDYVFARRVEASDDSRARKAWVAASVGLNLAVLGLFKYGDFAVANLNLAIGGLGLPPLPHPTAGLMVPIGLSFYTFQSIAYVVDVYRREIAAVRSWPDYMAFVSFFPLLAAGPIMRAGELVPQLVLPRPTPSLAGIGAALWLLVLGLFQKVVLADNLAPLVNLVFKAPAAFSGPDLRAAVYAFAFQIYFDFAGYSNMAMGVAALLGFRIPRNFAMPYVAVGLSDFWRRWHISLSRWLRDYLYVPLGGNRRGSLVTLRNLMLTMLLGGLWHGAGWTFVVWGALHGLYLGAERALAAAASRFGWGQRSPGPAAVFVARLVGMALTFHLVVLAWVPFRAEGGLAQALDMMRRMLSLAPGAPLSPPVAAEAPLVLAALATLAIAWLAAAARIELQPGPRVRALLAGLMLAALLLVPGNRNAFIYFQF